MKIKLIISAFLLQLSLVTYGQVSVAGVPESFLIKTKQAAIVPQRQLEQINTELLVQDDIKYGIANRYSVIQVIALDIKEKGLRTEITGKGYIWRYELSSSGAFSLGLTFSKYRLPAGARLFIYDTDHDQILGAFTHFNNKETQKLSIAELRGQNAVIEYFEPYMPEFEGKLVLGSVSQAYKDITSLLAVTSRIGINCPDGAEWQDEKHAVCRMTYQDGRNGYYCTGFLVNNVTFDGTPYFMTANHCISTNTVASTLVTYFNYENSNCSSSDASAIQTLSGASLKSTSTTSDFSLLLLNEIPPANYNAFLAGWDATTSNPQRGIAIHHPAGTPKCISVDNNQAESYPYKINWDNGITTLENTHWGVKFDTGGTESGSSGSPLFNQNSRVVGQLHGGDDTESFYGKFSVSWNKYNNASEQLKYWLDPFNTGITGVDGTYLKAKPKSAFSASYSQTCINEVITLIDQTKNSPTSWSWKIEPSSFSFVDGTNSNSRNPRVVFNETGQYSATLITSNIYGTDTLLNPNFLTVAGSIDVNFVSIPQDTVFCAYNLNTRPIIVKGAHGYTFGVSNSDKLDYNIKHDTLILDVLESAKKFGSFNVVVKVKGVTGSCVDNDSIKLNIVMPTNDYIANAVRLRPGNNPGFSNFCGCSEKNEPMPPLISCISQDSWCPDQSNSIVNNSIWFTFMGPSNGKVTIEAQSKDSRIAVYEAELYQNIISGNSSLYNLIAANDNQPGGSLSSRIEDLRVDPGRTYWLQVDSKAGKAGEVSVSLLSNSLEVFPNPSNGIFDLIISNLEEGTAYLSIYSSIGKQIFTKTLETTHDNNRFSVDLSALPSGIYNLKVKTATYTLSSKVMIFTN